MEIKEFSWKCLKSFKIHHIAHDWFMDLKKYIEKGEPAFHNYFQQQEKKLVIDTNFEFIKNLSKI